MVFLHCIWGRAHSWSFEFVVDWVEHVDIDAFFGETVCIEEDAGVAFEALAYHPAEGDLRWFVSLFICDCAAPDVGVAAGEPDFETVDISCDIVGVEADSLDLFAFGVCLGSAVGLESLSRWFGLAFGCSFCGPARFRVGVIFLLIPTYFELGSALIQAHSMSEVKRLVLRSTAQRQLSRDEANTGNAVEDSDKVDVDIDAESSLEVGAHVPSILSVVFVELIREWYLGAIVCWQKSNFVKHACEAASCVCASREAKKADLVTFAVGLHEKTVGISDVDTETAAHGHIDGSCDAIAQTSAVVCANAGLIVCELLWIILLEAADEMHDVAVISVEFVASTIKTDDQGTTFWCILFFDCAKISGQLASAWCARRVFCR